MIVIAKTDIDYSERLKVYQSIKQQLASNTSDPDKPVVVPIHISESNQLSLSVIKSKTFNTASLRSMSAPAVEIVFDLKEESDFNDKLFTAIDWMLRLVPEDAEDVLKHESYNITSIDLDTALRQINNDQQVTSDSWTYKRGGQVLQVFRRLLQGLSFLKAPTEEAA